MATTEMVGTEKQVAFAADIRTKALAEHAARIEAARAKGSDPAKIADVEAKVGRMAGITSSRWWIDNGRLDAQTRLQRVDWVYRDATGMGCVWMPA